MVLHKLWFISEIIDDITQLVDKTDSRIKNETHKVKLVENKSASCGKGSVIKVNSLHTCVTQIVFLQNPLNTILCPF